MSAKCVHQGLLNVTGNRFCGHRMEVKVVGWKKKSGMTTTRPGLTAVGPDNSENRLMDGTGNDILVTC